MLSCNYGGLFTHRFSKKSLALSHSDAAIVSDAFSFTGRYVARRLMEQGVSVRTLTRNPEREDPFGGLVPATPLDFSWESRNGEYGSLPATAGCGVRSRPEQNG